MTSTVQHAERPFSSSEGYAYLRRFNIVITIRSLVLLLFVSYLIYGPVYLDSDIVASVVALTLMVFILLLTMITLGHSLRLRNSFELQIFPPADAAAGSSEVFPKRAARFVFKTSPLKVFPGFILRVRCEFTAGEVKPAVFHLYGTSTEPRLIVQDLVFPHRGLWKLTNVQIEYGDRLELTHYQWSLPSEALDQVIRVDIPAEYDTNLPVICSASRPGELMQDMQKRQGDPYDLKPYHPSDGMRKILWKIYAKSGDLISRHPETSMTPEGEVVMFVLANKHDDHVCSANLAYLRLLEQLELQICLSCEGGRYLNVAASLEEARDLLVEAVWNTEYSGKRTTRSDLQHLFDSFETGGHSGNLQRVLIFCSEERLGTEVGADIAAAAGHYIEERGIKPVFCVARDIGGSSYFIPETEDEHINGASKLQQAGDYFKRLSFKPEPAKEKSSRRMLSKFMITCANNDWQIFT